MTTPSLAPLSAAQALDAFFLEGRCKVLDLAAILDRIDRGISAEQAHQDPRLVKLRQAIEALRGEGPDRAERIQQLFSRPYDPAWERPTPR